MPGVGLAAWGKFEPPGQFHRLEHHCADVAACFVALLGDPVLRDRFERASGGAGLCPVTEARLTVIAYLHDFGKLDTGFQFKVRDSNAWPCGTQPRKAGHIGKALRLPEMKRAVQEATLDNPLLILEGETGAGKTEAAILRFVDLWCAGRVDGLYFALPTRATAKQIHARVRRALNRLFPDEPWAETVLAIPVLPHGGHGGSGARRGLQGLLEGQARRGDATLPWAGGILAQVSRRDGRDRNRGSGVACRIPDQVGAALARSPLVVDEALASDAYLTELLRSVLQGHFAVDSPALLMSTTLGAVARTTFVNKDRRWEDIPRSGEAEPSSTPACAWFPSSELPT